MLKLSVGLLLDLMKTMMSESSKVYINGSEKSSFIVRDKVIRDEFCGSLLKIF